MSANDNRELVRSGFYKYVKLQHEQFGLGGYLVKCSLEA
jgi:hypothetical protein